jgi:hypothetical protein
MEGLDFSVPGQDKKVSRSPSKFLYGLMVVVLILLLANMTILLLSQRDGKDTTKVTLLPSDKQKQIALKLEKQGLNAASADAWKEYLTTSAINAEETARIWYRIGKLYMQENQYDTALAAFYRSESFGKPDDISTEIARLIQECLESMGRFAALRYELTDRTSSSSMEGDTTTGGSGDTVVAEIGPEKIMKSDLDRRIEYLIETQISQFAGYLTEDQINKQKEELLRQYSTDRQRKLFLNQYIGEELLYREAVKQGLMDSPELKSQLKDMERSFSASKLMENTYFREIKITQVDLETYFEANKEKYVEEEGSRQLTFDEARDRVALELRSLKEREVQEKLLERLKKEHDVVIHSSAF